jgi:hypothetical protein
MLCAILALNEPLKLKGIMRIKENREIIQDFFQACNLMGNEVGLAQEFFTQLRNEHRTIQQIALGIMKVVIDEFGGMVRENVTDMRNEHSFDWTKEVRELSETHPYRIPEMRFPFL